MPVLPDSRTEPRWRAFGGTHQGRVRPINEDRFLVMDEAGVFVIADGMGGHSHGDVASSAIVQSVEEELGQAGVKEKTAAVIGGVQLGNRRIRQIIADNDGLVIGSTFAGLVLDDERYSVLWTGDSRVYALSGQRLRALTQDHSEVAQLLRQGSITREQAENWPRKNVLLHAVGPSETVHIERMEGTCEGMSAFLLCTDGLTNHVRDEEIAAILADNEPQPACVALVRLALQRGGTDNVTVIVVKV